MADNYTLSAPEFGQPDIDIVNPWSPILSHVERYLKTEEKNTGYRVKQTEAVAYIMQQCKPPSGRAMSKNLAEAIFTLSRDPSRMSGGRPPGRKNP